MSTNFHLPLKMLLSKATTAIFAMLLILILPFALLLALIGAMADAPLKRTRLRKLNNNLESIWIPRRRYIYVRHHASYLSPLFEEKILGQFGKYIVYEYWDTSKGTWINDWNGFIDSDKKIVQRDKKALVEDLDQEYDGKVVLYITFIDPITHKLSRNYMQVYKDNADDRYILDDDQLAEEQIIDAASEYIEGCLLLHRIASF